jgi:hypothetical protein
VGPITASDAIIIYLNKGYKNLALVWSKPYLVAIMKRYSILLIVMISFSAQAQMGYMNYLTFDKRFNKVNGEVDGSPLLSEDWAPGYVIFQNNHKLEKARLRYNAFDNFLEVNVLDVEYVAEASNYKEFGYTDPATNKSIVYKNVVLANKEVLPLQILAENKIIFGLHNQIRIGRGSASGSGGLNPVKDKFERSSTLYLIKDGQATKITRNKKSIMDVLEDQASSVEAFIKTNRIDVKKDDDLVQLLTFYTSNLK